MGETQNSINPLFTHDIKASAVVPTICSVVVTYNPVNPIVCDYIMIALAGTTVEADIKNKN